MTATTAQTGATIESCLAEATARLQAAEVDNPRREARLLLAHATGLDQAALIGHPDRPVAERQRFLDLVERRARREPLAQILGQREFWSLAFRVTADTLDPRPESESLVEAALVAVADRRNDKLSILDLGTGTGCLLLAILSELPQARGVGVDISPEAIAVAQDNAWRLSMQTRTRFLVSNWADAIDATFDLVISNPPYIARDDIERLQPEVALYEPRLALDGGADGMVSYRDLCRALPRLIRMGGHAAVEVGDGQWEAVAALFRAAHLHVHAPVTDLSGTRRGVVCTPAGKR